MNRSEAIAWHVGCVVAAFVLAWAFNRYGSRTEQALLRRLT